MLPPLPVPLPEEPVTNTSSFVATARVKLIHWGSSCWHKQLSFVGCRNILRVVCISRPPLHEESVCFGFISCSREWGKSLSQDLPWHGCVLTSGLSCKAEMLRVPWKTLMSSFLQLALTHELCCLSFPFTLMRSHLRGGRPRGFTF